jgi:hypothetical protein
MKQSPWLSARLFPILTALLLICGSQVHAGDVPSADELAKIRTEATQGDAASQARLADIYRYGKGVKIDYQEAFQWARKAADQDNAQAQHYLGLCSKYEMGVKKDMTEAFKWFQKSAEQGYVASQYRVGQCYFKGEGIPKDDQQAIHWMEKAANRGDVDAKFMLGLIYARLAWDEKKEYDASHDYQKSATEYRLDQQRAYMWWNLAAAGGFVEAKDRLSSLAESMAASDIAEAQRMSSVWQPASEASNPTH